MNITETWKKNWNTLIASDKTAKAAGTLVGRYIQHQYADSYAVYLIVGVTSRTAQIEVVTGIGDDWVLPAWGTKASIRLTTAQEFVANRDRLDRMFNRG